MRRRSLALGALTTLGCLTLAASAVAEPKTHDGFMLQLELGPGYASLPGTAEEAGTSTDVDVRGMSCVGGTFVGGTPAPGLVVGGATLGHVIYSPKMEVGGQEVDGYGDDNLSLSLVGPFVQYYPDPSSGLNLRLALGFVWAKAMDDNIEDAATGFGVNASLGHDWWVGDEWSLGMAARVTYAHVREESTGVGGDDKVLSHSAYVPGVVLTLTYH
jgi:hypothetical protein